MSLQYISDVFWARSFWLPPNCTWVNMTNTDPEIYKPQDWDLLYSFPLAILLLVVRYLVENLIFRPIGKLYHLRDRPHRKAAHNDILEAMFQKNRNPSNDEIHAVSKKIGMEDARISSWLKTRRQQERPPTMKRFTEAGWRATFYMFMQVFLINLIIRS